MKRILWLIIINVFVIIILSLTAPNFLTKNNLIVIVDNMALEAIALSGYVLLLVSGNFDLSIDGIVALCGVTAGLLMNSGVHWIIATVLSLTLSIVIGTINGITVAKLGINGLIATLTTWWICIGITFGMTKAIAPYGFPDAFQWLGQARIFGFRTVGIYATIIAIISAIVLDRTKLGAHIYAIGDNEEASKMMGVDVIGTKIKMYVLVGLLAGIIGIMITSKLNAASPMAVDGMALRVIAASVIGGANLSGGRGSIIGGLLGLCLMSILSNAIIQLGISPYWQKAILGGILLSAVLVERSRRL